MTGRWEEAQMKRLAAGLAIAALLVAGPALADTVQNSFGNTITVTYPNGAVVRYLFNADNTFSATAPDGTTTQGTYEIAGGQFCLTPQGGERGCTAYVGDKNVGDTWTQTATDGSSISVSIVAGR